MLRSQLFSKKNTKKRNRNQIGSTVIEILIATAVVGTIMTSVVIGLTYSVRNTSEARYQDIATQLAQDGLELFRKERVRMGWSIFEQRLGSATYCLTDVDQIAGNAPNYSLSITSTSNISNCGGIAVSGVTFRRGVQVVNPGGTDEVQLNVIVQWEASGVGQRSVNQKQTFYQPN